MLNDIPLASWLVVGVIAILGVALVVGTVTFDQFKDFLISVGTLAGGAGVLGEARNRAGHGKR